MGEEEGEGEVKEEGKREEAGTNALSNFPTQRDPSKSIYRFHHLHQFTFSSLHCEHMASLFCFPYSPFIFPFSMCVTIFFPSLCHISRQNNNFPNTSYAFFLFLSFLSFLLFCILLFVSSAYSFHFCYLSLSRLVVTPYRSCYKRSLPRSFP